MLSFAGSEVMENPDVVLVAMHDMVPESRKGSVLRIVKLFECWKRRDVL